MELLAYTSTASEAVDGSDVFQIVAASARNNAESEITGVLLLKEGRFFQIIEGPETSVDALMSRLKRDNRHSDIRTIGRIAIAERAFPNWNMKRLFNLSSRKDENEVRAVLLGLKVSAEFKNEVRMFLDGTEQEAAA